MNTKQLELAHKAMAKVRYRNLDVEIKALHDPEEDEEKGRISFSASSNEPVETFIFTEDFMGRALEVLSHKEGDMDLTRFNKGTGHFILDHNPRGLDTNLGIIENASVDGKKLNVDVKFNKFNPDAERVENEMKGGQRPNISIGFVRDNESAKMIRTDKKTGLPVFEFKSAIHEVSSVLIPADISVGVGRESDEELLYRELGLDSENEIHNELASALLKEMNGETKIDETVSGEALIKKGKMLKALADRLGTENDDNSNEGLLIVETKSAGDSTADADSFKETVMSEQKQDESTVVEATAGADLELAKKDNAEAIELCRSQDNLEMALEVSQKNWSLEYTKGKLFDAAQTKREIEGYTPREVGQKEQKELNLNVAMRNFVASAAGKGGSPVNDLGREIAIACGINPRPDAMYIPINRNLTTLVDVDGGNIVGTDFRPLAESLFDETVAAQVGVVFDQVSSTQQIPRWDNNNVATWVAEDSAIGLTTGSLSIVTANPNQLVSHVPITPFLGVAVDGAYDPINATLDNMVESLKDQAETAIWQGTGTEQPLGLLNDSSVAGIVSGTAADNALYGALWETVRDNAHRGAGPFVVSSDVYRAGVDNAALANGTDRATITVSAGVASTDYGRVVDSQHLPALSAVYGSFNAVLAANFGVIEIRRDQSMQAANGLDVLIARMFFDVVVTNPGKLSKSDGEVDLTP